MRLISQDNLIDIPYKRSVLYIVNKGDHYSIYAKMMDQPYFMGSYNDIYTCKELLRMVRTAYNMELGFKIFVFPLNDKEKLKSTFDEFHKIINEEKI